jgi:hypothetical protein
MTLRSVVRLAIAAVGLAGVGCDKFFDLDEIPQPAARIAHWQFAGGSGAMVADREADPLDLQISSMDGVSWEPAGLRVLTPVRIESLAPATKISDACKDSNAITVEAWITPASNQQGTLLEPARVFALSRDVFNANLMLGQDGERWVLRVRTEMTADTGEPRIVSPESISDTPIRTHLVGVFDGANRMMYVDGRLRAIDEHGVSLASWNDSYRVTIANELGALERPWLGTIHEIAIYPQALSAAVIAERARLR